MCLICFVCGVFSWCAPGVATAVSVLAPVGPAVAPSAAVAAEVVVHHQAPASDVSLQLSLPSTTVSPMDSPMYVLILHGRWQLNFIMQGFRHSDASIVQMIQ